MNTEFGEQLQGVIEKSNFHANGYVWKAGKEKDANGNFVQKEVKLMEATVDQLRGFLAHCNSMLNNQDKDRPGRYPLLQIIQSQKDRCGVELFLRESEAEGVSRYTIIDSIKQVIRNSGISQEQMKSMVLGDFIVVKSQFHSLPIKLIQDGCLNRLGKFDKSHITLTFILKQGLRILPEEEKELSETFADGSKRNYLDVVRERLNIVDHLNLKIDSKGLTYSQLRAMLNLRNRYYNELTVDQLKTLRYRILFSLEDEIMFHISQWENRMGQIKEVATIREITL